MRFIEDISFKYKDEMRKELKTFNLKYTGQKDSSNEYFYALEGERLVGSLYTHYFWDWVDIDMLFYENLECLKKLLSNVCVFYKNKAVGIKLYTEVKTKAVDFQTIGFEIGGMTEKTPKTPSYFYLVHTAFDIQSNAGPEIMMSKEKIDQYHSIVINQVKSFNKSNHIEPMKEHPIMFVALEQEEFIGAVHGTIIEDSMYINWLVVKEKYKGNGVGRKLMQKIEEKAKDLNVYSISLGTTGFQAKGFYEKLGYKLVLIEENEPKGYHSYTMVKKI